MSKEWIGEIPNHWSSAQLRHVARVFAGGTPDRKRPDFWEQGEVPWLNSGSVNQETITLPSEYVTRKAALSGATRWVRKGSVVVALAGQGKTKGMAARTEIDTTLNQSLAAIEPCENVDYRFLHYWLKSNYRRIRGLAGGDLRDGLNLEHVSSIFVPLPPLVEQEQIADYLDHETAEIDAFIADQKELLGRLAERVRSEIWSAVTAGLDGATSSSTDLDWAPEVPNHWSIQRISWLFGAIGSGTTPSTDDTAAFEGDVPWVTTGELRETGIEDTERNLSPAALKKYSLRLYPQGSILIAMYGATIGRLGWLERPATVNQAVCVLADYKAGPARFAFYSLLGAREYIITLASGGGQANVNQEKIRALRIPIPPVEEQERIVKYLDATVNDVSALVADSKQFISLARERRSALISAAVTGKLDVTSKEAVA